MNLRTASLLVVITVAAAYFSILLPFLSRL